MDPDICNEVKGVEMFLGQARIKKISIKISMEGSRTKEDKEHRRRKMRHAGECRKAESVNVIRENVPHPNKSLSNCSNHTHTPFTTGSA